MKSWLTVLLLAAVCTSCSKSNKAEDRYTACDAKMIEKFKDEINCQEKQVSPCNYLAKGKYKGELIYFIDIYCITCGIIAPQEGYNCKGRKVIIKDFSKNVTDVVFVKPVLSDQ